MEQFEIGERVQVSRMPNENLNIEASILKGPSEHVNIFGELSYMVEYPGHIALWIPEPNIRRIE